jgi:hypothetical protein
VKSVIFLCTGAFCVYAGLLGFKDGNLAAGTFWTPVGVAILIYSFRARQSGLKPKTKG